MLPIKFAPTRFRSTGIPARPLVLFLGLCGTLLAPSAHARPSDCALTKSGCPQAPTTVVVTASRRDLLGKADTASQGAITREELMLRPVYRVGQLLESVPGLVVAIHSGEGKANQYLIRGFNLDHGTDLAVVVDGMPVNRPTNTHGQGYSDMNFLMAPLTSGLDYTKGPYYAAIGDFGSVASVHVRLADNLPNQIAVTAGTARDEDLFAGGTANLAPNSRLLGAFAVGHYDGPWSPPQNFNKLTGALRYSRGSENDHFSLTTLYYKSSGNLATDQPLRAIDDGQIGRFGTLDPSDASRSERFSLSTQYSHRNQTSNLEINGYFIHSSMTLWNDFTHYLDDPLLGDQEQQDEKRSVFGAGIAYHRQFQSLTIPSEISAGFQLRYDIVDVDRRHTHLRATLAYCEIPNPVGPGTPFIAVDGYCNDDQVELLNTAPYVDLTSRWTSWFRSVIGVRDDTYDATDQDRLQSEPHRHRRQTLIQPKANLIFGPWFKTEVYLSAGRGYHSNDVRGVLGTEPGLGVPLSAGTTPLMSSTTGTEAGLRSNLIPKVQLQLAIFRQTFRSELAYNADEGEDESSAPSLRQGVEVSLQYRPRPWIELNADLAFSKARYTGSLATLEAFDLDGRYISNAPAFIGSAGILIDNLGPWSGGLAWRSLGRYPITDGPKLPEDKGYSEANINVGYQLTPKISVRLDVYNLTDTKANASAFYYTSRLPGEPANGVSDDQVHPLEPRSARLTLTRHF